MDEMQHGEHMEQMKAGLAQILQIAQQMGIQPIVEIAQSLLGAEQEEQKTEEGANPQEQLREGLRSAIRGKEAE